MKFTIIGGQGFIGSAVASLLKSKGYDVFTPKRGAPLLYDYQHDHIIYAAGVTADFRSRPFDTMQAHVGLLSELLQHAKFASLTYLSSTRIYRRSEKTKEESVIPVYSEDPEDYYNVTKLAGEALCFASGRSDVKVIRISNVVGKDFSSPNFIYELIRSAYQKGHIELYSSLESEKDYIMIDDVANMIVRISLQGKHRCYNLASGFNISHKQIVDTIISATGASLSVVPGAPKITMLPIDIQRLKTEFKFCPQNIIDQIPLLIDHFRRKMNV